MFYDQAPFGVRFDWGERGLDAIGPGCGLIVIVDVLSFCTSVDVALARGAQVLPFSGDCAAALQFAVSRGAVVAGKRSLHAPSLSPASLTSISPGTRLVLPSPNGATLCLRAAEIGPTVTACLRNAAAVATYSRSVPGPVAVIACGERWGDGSLRPAFEDLVGAGAVIFHLGNNRSPEAQVARDTFRTVKRNLRDLIRGCTSGRELLERGFEQDVDLAAECDVSRCVSMLQEGAIVSATQAILAGHKISNEQDCLKRWPSK